MTLFPNAMKQFLFKSPEAIGILEPD